MDSDAVIRLRRVVLKLARQLNAASREEGLTPTQASVLGITTMRGPLSLAELTELEGINPTMLSRVIGKLDEYGLLKRLRDPDDFRAARVEVTPKGRAVYERITAQRSAVISESVSGRTCGTRCGAAGTGSGTRRGPTDPIRPFIIPNGPGHCPRAARMPSSRCPKSASLRSRRLIA
jgi:DNA-binding MarR family transcriptional regulator